VQGKGKYPGLRLNTGRGINRVRIESKRTEGEEGVSQVIDTKFLLGTS